MSTPRLENLYEPNAKKNSENLREEGGTQRPAAERRVQRATCVFRITFECKTLYDTNELVNYDA